MSDKPNPAGVPYPPNPPETRYRTIVADPPWHYDRMVGRTIGGGDGWQPRGLPYPSMTLDEIRALPVGSLAHADGARLFLWTTNRYLPAAFTVIEAWGFRYQQTLAWHKTNASPYAGAVAVLDLEFLLVAQRGTPGRGNPARSSLISHAISRHSAKPEAFLDTVELVSPGPWVELFARRARFGWDYWGEQSLGTAEMPSGTVPATSVASDASTPGADEDPDAAAQSAVPAAASLLPVNEPETDT